MRRRLLVSTCIAVVLIAALSVTAFAAVEVTGPDSVTTGSTIEIRITGTTMGLAANIKTTGLEFVNANGGLSDESSVILLKDIGGMEGVYTYRVTATEGQQVSFALTRVTESDGTQDIPMDNITWAGTVGGSFATVTTQPTATVAPAVQTQDVQQTATPADEATVSAEATITAAPTVTTNDEATATATATEGPRTTDGSVNVWILIIAAAACALVAIFVGRKIYKTVR